MTTEKACGWCKEKASMTCGNCNNISYCSREHQKNHWKKHKEECRPFYVKVTSEGGRFLVASKALPAGYIIIKEAPICIGPSAASTPVCLTCHLPVEGKSYFRCPECSWPMCSSSCSDSPDHKPECLILRKDPKKIGVPLHDGETPRYDLILILRCLLLKSTNCEKWKTFLDLESHVHSWMASNEPHHVAAVRYLTEVVNLDSSTEEVHKARGTILTNGIKTTTTEGVILRGIYPTTSLLNHSCIPNITLRSDKLHNIYVRTTIPVCKGDPLTFSYVSCCDPVWKRQEDLKTIYNFQCDCFRCCTDNYDLHFSCPRCPNCADSYITHTESFSEDWSCKLCPTKMSLTQIKSNVKDCLETINNKKLQQKHSKLFLKGIAEKWHSKHYVYIECLQKMLNFLKDNSSLDLLGLRHSAWKELLDAYSTIEPGYTRRRGVSLVELGTTIVTMLEKNKNMEEEEKVALRYECSEVLDEATKILDLEPPDTTENKWKIRALKVQKRLSAISSK